MGTLGTGKGNEPQLNVGVVHPYSLFNKRKYSQAIMSVVGEINKQKEEFKFLDKFKFGIANVAMVQMKVNPSPTGNAT